MQHIVTWSLLFSVGHLTTQTPGQHKAAAEVGQLGKRSGIERLAPSLTPSQCSATEAWIPAPVFCMMEQCTAPDGVDVLFQDLHGERRLLHGTVRTHQCI